MPKRPLSVRVELTEDEVRSLQGLARFYDKSVGPVRFLVRSTSRAEVRERFRFVAEESEVLEDLARTIGDEMVEGGEPSREIDLLLRAAVAYWGRVLASLNTERARRKTPDDEIERRESLDQKLTVGIRGVARRNREAVEREIATRRPVEAELMRERLGLSDV